MNDLATTEVANLWYYLKTIQLRVGVTAATYSYAGEGRLGLSGFTRNPDPWVELIIPKGATNIIQEITTGKKLEGFIELADWNVVTDLFYTIDVDNDLVGVQTAIEANNTRTVIDYFALVGVPIQIVAATDARTTPTASYVFSNTVIRDIQYRLERPSNPIVVRFYADSVTETVA